MGGCIGEMGALVRRVRAGCMERALSTENASLAVHWCVRVRTNKLTLLTAVLK